MCANYIYRHAKERSKLFHLSFKAGNNLARTKVMSTRWKRQKTDSTWVGRGRRRWERSLLHCKNVAWWRWRSGGRWMGRGWGVGLGIRYLGWPWVWHDSHPTPAWVCRLSLGRWWPWGGRKPAGSGNAGTHPPLLCAWCWASPPSYTCCHRRRGWTPLEESQEHWKMSDFKADWNKEHSFFYIHCSRCKCVPFVYTVSIKD